MAPRIGDRWVWLGFGVFLFFAARHLRQGITETVRLTEIDPAQYEAGEKDDEKAPEDSISLETLQTLAESPDPNIANSAISLIVTRFAQAKDASQLLAKDAYSSDPTLRSQARTAIGFLKDWPLPPGSDRDPDLDMPWSLPRRWATSARFNAGGIGLDDTDDEVEWPPDIFPDVSDPGATDADGLRRTGIEVVGEVDRAITADEALETERRRRRREAMVLHEGSGRLEEGDIIRPR